MARDTDIFRNAKPLINDSSITPHNSLGMLVKDENSNKTASPNLFSSHIWFLMMDIMYNHGTNQTSSS